MKSQTTLFFLEVTPKSDIQLWMRYLHILHIFKAYYILEQECKPDCDTMVPSQNLLVIVLLSIISTSCQHNNTIRSRSGQCMKGEAKSICLPNDYVKVSFAGLCCCLTILSIFCWILQCFTIILWDAEQGNQLILHLCKY